MKRRIYVSSWCVTFLEFY